MKPENNKVPSGAEWIADLSSKELSQPERAALADWLRESPVHVRDLVEHAFLRQDLANLPIDKTKLDAWVVEARASAGEVIPLRANDAATSASSSGSDASLPQRATIQRAKYGPSHWRKPFPLAAGLIAAVIGGSLFWQSHAGLYSTRFAEQRTLTLDDGSIVSLNTESKIKVDFSKQQRSIELLQGEAFFRVARDAQRPFLVNAGDTMVRAVGTQFNVKLALKNTLVSVIDGRVNVSVSDRLSGPEKGEPFDGKDNQRPSSSSAIERAKRSAKVITLAKGEEALIARTPADSGNTSPPIVKEATPAVLRAAAWTQGRLEFEAIPLADVLAEFQRYKNFSVRYDDDFTRQLKLTGSFDAHDPDAVLAYIETIPGIAVEKMDQQTYAVHHTDAEIGPAQ